MFISVKLCNLKKICYLEFREFKTLHLVISIAAAILDFINYPVKTNSKPTLGQ